MKVGNTKHQNHIFREAKVGREEVYKIEVFC